MRKRLTQVMLGGGAAALAICLSATAASAATWSVSPGGAFTTTGSGQVKDTKTGTVAKCTSIKLAGTLKSGKGLSGSGIGTVTSATFSGCTIATITVTVTAQNLPWKMNALSYNATAGRTTASLVGIRLLATAPGCSATLEGTTATNGTTKFSYTNSTGKLALLGPGGNLTSENVSGCFGLVNNGDPQQASGPSTVSPKQTITSP